MSSKTIRPGLTAAMTAGRALLAAGWKYDSTTPMADDTTIRTLLHPSGREIHARTVDRVGDDTTTLTMTGLDLTQAAGAITGAGLAPTEPVSGYAPTPGPSYFKAVDELQAAVRELISRDIDDPRGWIAYTAAKSGALAAEQNKLRRQGESEPTEPDVRQQFAAHLHRIADAIVTQQLPLYELLSARLSLGVLDSRADLQRWADYLGTEIAEDGGSDDNIPYIEHKTLFDDREWGPWLSVQAQINPDADRTAGGTR